MFKLFGPLPSSCCPTCTSVSNVFWHFIPGLGCPQQIKTKSRKHQKAAVSCRLKRCLSVSDTINPLDVSKMSKILLNTADIILNTFWCSTIIHRGDIPVKWPRQKPQFSEQPQCTQCCIRGISSRPEHPAPLMCLLFFLAPATGVTCSGHLYVSKGICVKCVKINIWKCICYCSSQSFNSVQESSQWER